MMSLFKAIKLGLALGSVSSSNFWTKKKKIQQQKWNYLQLVGTSLELNCVTNMDEYAKIYGISIIEGR